MASYYDLLRSVNERLGFNAEDPDRADDNCNWKLSFSAKPKKHIDLTMSKQQDQKVSDDGVVSEVEKTSSKLKINHGDCTTTYSFANDKMGFDAKGKAVDDDGMKVSIGGAGEVKQAKSEWKGTASMDINAKDVGGANVAINASAEYNQKGAITVKPKINIEVADEFNVGVSGKSDTKAMQEIWPQFVYKPKDCKDSFYWVRGDLTRKLLMAGCDQVLKEGIQHSFEGVYGWGKDFKGIKGQPVALRAGVEYELSDQTTVTASGNWDETYSVSQEVQHKIDNNWTVSASQSFDSSSLGGKTSPYHIGFTASYKL